MARPITELKLPQDDCYSPVSPGKIFSVTYQYIRCCSMFFMKFPRFVLGVSGNVLFLGRLLVETDAYFVQHTSGDVLFSKTQVI